MPFSVRRARPDDAPAIARVHTQSWRETYPGLMPAAFLDGMTSAATLERRTHTWTGQIGRPGQPVYVAEIGGEVVGFASGGPAAEHPGVDAEVYTLYSLKAAQGLGRALFQAVVGELQAGGASTLALWVLDLNPTRAWYARQGAQEDGEKTVPIPGGALREVRMVWNDLGVLLGR
ncbi:GNAT family N-acetyltransferase [Deinococcus hohokamensis]|uniref:GNAT family N-acetyltransferase n=1 Tax=Deinococcus hohokamensis TaxID=309883 RepID=A0ABV9ICW4_9DEIO